MEDKRKLIAICLANFIWSFGSFVNVVLVFYIPAKFNTTELQTGIVMSLVSVAIFSGTIIYPKLIYRFSPIKIYKYAVGVGAISYLGASLFFDQFWVVVPLVLIAYVTFSLTRSLNKKIISIVLAGSARRKAFNYTFAVANFGGVFAGVISPFIFSLNTDNMQYIFLVNFIFTIISYLVLAHGVKDEADKVQVKPVKETDSKFKIDYRLLFATSAIYFGFFQISYLIPRSIETNYSLHVYSLAIVINTMVCVFASPFSIKVFSHYQVKEYTTLMFGAVLMIISFVFYNIIGLQFLVIATVCFAVGEVLFITNLDSYLLKIYSLAEYDQVLVAVRILAQINRAIGPIVASLCIMYFNFQTAFAIVIIYMLIGMIPLAQFNKQHVKKHGKL